MCAKTVLNKNEETKEEYFAISDIKTRIEKARRPIILIGNGVRDCDSRLIDEIAKQNQIPILSSRSSQDILQSSEMYFGFIGSRATRYSNFIISKADLIISLGNRLAFPIGSKSFKPIVENATTIRIDIDKNEFLRAVPNSIDYQIDVCSLIPKLKQEELKYDNPKQWISVCKTLKDTLNQWDRRPIIDVVMSIIASAEDNSTVVCDVGNHSFWVTTALAYLNKTNRVLYSASFGTLGCALPKAIGAYYATRKPVICFSGDQGIQFNIQELQYVSNHNIPIIVVVINNYSSGMIMEREQAKYGEYLVHTTIESGYSFPNFEKIATAYNMDYMKIESNGYTNFSIDCYRDRPLFIEVMVDKNTELYPSLPMGNECQNLYPILPRDLYEKLNNL